MHINFNRVFTKHQFNYFCQLTEPFGEFLVDNEYYRSLSCGGSTGNQCKSQTSGDIVIIFSTGCVIDYSLYLILQVL